MNRFVLVAIALSLANASPARAWDDYFGSQADCIQKPDFDKDVQSGKMKIIAIGLRSLGNPMERPPEQPGPYIDLTILAKRRWSFLVYSDGRAQILDTHVDYDLQNKKVMYEYACVRTKRDSFMKEFSLYFGGPYTFLPPE